MSSFALRGLDDSRRIRIVAARPLGPSLPDGTTAYDAGYRRITGEHEVPVGRARIFETGGTSVLVIREGNKLSAFNADSLLSPETGPHLIRAQRFAIDNEMADGTVLTLEPMPVTIEDGWIWVDVENASS